VEDAERRRTPSALRTLRLAFKLGYDDLGLLMAGTIFWNSLTFAPLLALRPLRGLFPGWGGALALAMSGLAAVALQAAANSGLFHLTCRIAEREDRALSDLWHGIRLFFLPALGLTSLIAAIVLGTGANALFYFLMVARRGAAFRILAFLWVEALVVFLLLAIYAYPAIVKLRKGALASLKASALLALRNATFTLLLAGALLLWHLLLFLPLLLRWKLLSGVPILLLMAWNAGFVSLVSNQALVEILLAERRAQPTGHGQGA
jgi:hypothetical protein